MQSPAESNGYPAMLTTFPKPHFDRRAGPPAIFDPRHGSLVRGSLLVLGSFIAVLAVSGLSADHAMPLLAIPALVAIAGTLDTARCMHGRWSLYEGGVYFLLLMDLMAMCLILFFLITPYVIYD